MPTREQRKELEENLKIIEQSILDAINAFQTAKAYNDWYIDNVGGAIDVDYFLEETTEGQKWERSVDNLEECDDIMTELYEQAQIAIVQCKKYLNEVTVTETGKIYEPPKKKKKKKKL